MSRQLHLDLHAALSLPALPKHPAPLCCSAYRTPQLDAWMAGSEFRLAVPYLTLGSSSTPATLSAELELAELANWCDATEVDVTPLPTPDLQVRDLPMLKIPWVSCARHTVPCPIGTIQVHAFKYKQQDVPPPVKQPWSLLNHFRAQLGGSAIATNEAPLLLDIPMLPPSAGGSPEGSQSTGTGNNLWKMVAEQSAPADVPPEGLRSLADATGSGGAVQVRLPLPQPAELPTLAVQPAIPAFLRRARQRQGPAMPASQPLSASRLIRLELPVLLPLPEPSTCTLDVRAGVPVAAFASLFAPPPPPDCEPPAPTHAPEDCKPLSLEELLDRDLSLEDGVLMLPAVDVEAAAEGGDQADSGKTGARREGGCGL